MTEQKRDKHGRFLPNKTQWYLGEKSKNVPYKVGYFDLEFSDLKSNFGYITCWSIKTRDSKEIHTDIITKREIFDGTMDRRLVRNFCETMLEYDLLVGYYSSCADVPYIRGKAMHYRFPFPKYKQMSHLDIYFSVRGKVATHSKSLKTICQYLGIKGKVDLTPAEWLGAKLGDPDALEKLKLRNIHDCTMLERLHKRFEPFIKFNRNYL